MCSGHEVSFVCGPIRLRSGTDSEAASALDEESGGAAIVSLEEAQKIHQKNGRLDQTMCTVGRWTYWIIVTIIERFAKPAMCVICGHDSRTPSPFHRSHKTDQFGGCWPWRYRMDKRQLLRIVTGSRCAICATCYDVRGPLAPPHPPQIRPSEDHPLESPMNKLVGDTVVICICQRLIIFIFGVKLIRAQNK